MVDFRPITAPASRVSYWEDSASNREQAALKADDLLMWWLPLAQKLTWACHGYIDVRGNLTGARYRLYKGAVYNIKELDDKGDFVQRLCFGPFLYQYSTLPIGDVVLAQKIILENDEERALRIASVTFKEQCYFSGAGDVSEGLSQ